MGYISQIAPALLKGAVISLELFAATLIISLPLGLPIGIGENSKNPIISGFCKLYVLVFRGTPLMLQLFFFYFFFPISLGIKLDAFPTAVITFALNYAAYFAEIYRGGINSIDRGQYEACHSLGLSKRQTMMDIILPQTFRAVIPPISNEVIVLVKDTTIASTIALADIMRVSKGIVNRDGVFTAYILAALMYLVFSWLCTVVLKKAEERYSKYDAQEA